MVEKRVGAFRATDPDGNVVIVEVWQDFHKTVRGNKTLRTKDGRHVNQLDYGKYQIQDGPELTSDDPNAP
jgi:hypothetical protein